MRHEELICALCLRATRSMTDSPKHKDWLFGATDSCVTTRTSNVEFLQTFAPHDSSVD
jgi:hypothetical protein